MNLLPARITTRTPEQIRDFWPLRVQLGSALNGKQTYEGTVPAHVKAKRRAKGKAARLARKAHR